MYFTTFASYLHLSNAFLCSCILVQCLVNTQCTFELYISGSNCQLTINVLYLNDFIGTHSPNSVPIFLFLLVLIVLHHSHTHGRTFKVKISYFLMQISSWLCRWRSICLMQSRTYARLNKKGHKGGLEEGLLTPHFLQDFQTVWIMKFTYFCILNTIKIGAAEGKILNYCIFKSC